MVVIPIAIAVVAATALVSYNTAHAQDETALAGRVSRIRQAAGVVGALVTLVTSVLDALAGLRTVFGGGSGPVRPPRIGGVAPLVDDAS